MDEVTAKKRSKKGDVEADQPTLVEIGPRFVMTPIRIFEGSFGGATLYENPGESRRGNDGMFWPLTLSFHRRVHLAQRRASSGATSKGSGVQDAHSEPGGIARKEGQASKGEGGRRARRRQGLCLRLVRAGNAVSLCLSRRLRRELSARLYRLRMQRRGERSQLVSF